MSPGPGSPRRRVSAVALLLALAGCGPPPPAAAGGEGPLGLLGENAPAWIAAKRDSDLAMAVGRWREAARRLEDRVGLYPAPGDAGLPSILRDSLKVDLYNLACVRALAGEIVPALDALDRALADGFGVIGFDHLGDDPDLDPLRGEPRFRALVERLSWNERVGLGGPLLDRRGPVPLLVVLRGEGAPDSVSSVAPDGPGDSFAVAVPDPPYRVAPAVRAWTTRLDRGEQAARKAAFAVEDAGRRIAVDRRRVVLFARDREMAGLAWEILLRRPGSFTHAVLEGPAPPARDLLGRGGEALPVKVFAVGQGSAPPPPLAAEVVPTVGEALRRILD